MTSLEQIVLPLEQSRSLVEHGVVLDTAMVWWKQMADEARVVHCREHTLSSFIDCPAPTLSELLDAIRAAVGKPTDETTVILSRDGSEAGASCAGVRTEGGKYEIASAPTDLLATYALLLEVAK